jgi:hypothetical protein
MSLKLKSISIAMSEGLSLDPDQIHFDASEGRDKPFQHRGPTKAALQWSPPDAWHDTEQDTRRWP